MPTSFRLSDQIYRVMVESHQSLLPLEVADLLRHRCTYRSYLQLLRSPWDTPPSGPALSLISAHDGWRATQLRKYLEKSYGDRYEPPRDEGEHYHRNVLHVRHEGFIDNIPLFVEMRPEATYKDGRLPGYLKNVIAARASLLESSEEALVIVMNQNSQKWVGWRLTGDFDPIGDFVREATSYLILAFQGDGEFVGVSQDCDRCQFASSCDVEEKLESVGALPKVEFTVRRDDKLINVIDTYLWSQNNRDNGRMKKVLHPSELTGSPQGKKCDRVHGYALLGTQERRRISSDLFRVFDMGHAWHDFIQDMTSYIHGEEFVCEKKVVHPELRIAGHCDGVMYDEVDEIKTISTKGYGTLSKPKTEHIDQATIYAMTPDVLKPYIRFLYVDKDTGSIKEFRPKVSSRRWRRIAERASRIVKTVGEGNLPPQLEDDGYICRGCKYVWTCKPHLTSRRRNA